MPLVGREQDWQCLVSNRAEGHDPSTRSCVLHTLSASILSLEITLAESHPT